MPDIDTTVADFRQCFCNEVGNRVLVNMLLEAKFFDQEHTPEEQAVSNFMKKIMCKLGAYNMDNADDFVKALLSLRVKVD